MRSNFTFFEFSESHRRKKLTEICESDSGKELPRGVLDHPNMHNNDLDPLWGLELHPLSFYFSLLDSFPNFQQGVLSVALQNNGQ